MFNGARISRGMFCRFVACVLFVTCSVFIFTDALSVSVSLNIFFEHDPDRGYPELEFECLKAVTVEAFVSNSGHRFHFPATLTIEYDASLVKPNTDVPLTFTIAPVDGAGSEYDLKRGLKFNIDGTFYDWGFKYGNDVEGDFVPPMESQTKTLDDMLVSIWDKGKWCFGSAEVGLYTVEGFEGIEIKVPLYIETPHNDTWVWFASTGTDTLVLSFKSNTTFQETLKIGAYAQDIRISKHPVVDPEYIINQTESLIQPGFEINAVNPKWSWFPNPCRQKTYFKLYFPWIDGESTTRSIPINDEGDPISWLLNNVGARSNVAGIQDLAIRSHRLSSARPEIGSSDTVVSIIKNLHGAIGREYEWIRLDYYIHDASAIDKIIPIGSKTLSSSSPELARFNSGDSDDIRVDFIYDDRNENYIFTEDHAWDPYEPLPRYVVKMASKTKDPGDSGDDWLCVPDDPSLPGANVFKVPFDTPMPDFAIDSLVVDCPPHLQFRFLPEDPDTAKFVFRVTNRGSAYPGGGTVPFTCNLLFQQLTDVDTWTTQATAEVYSTSLPPLGADSCWIDSFECYIEDTYSALAIDRALFLFEVNPDPATSLVDEQIFDLDNNTMETWVNLADYPDTAYASGGLFSTGAISPYLPNINATPPCTDVVYLYVTDETFVANGLAPANLLVQIGAGGFDTSPRDSLWVWFPCSYNKDFTDVNGTLWKVYEGYPGLFTLEDDQDYSYCFRASINYLQSPVNPAFIYVDNDGAASGAGRYCTTCPDFKDNAYYYDNAGYMRIASEVWMNWTVGDGSLFQDNFPEVITGDADSTNIEHFVRADMAADISETPESRVIPGDSIVVGCRPLNRYGIAVDGDGNPRIYMHLKCASLGSDDKLPLYGPSLEGTYGEYESDDGGTWTLIQGDYAYVSGEGPTPHLYMFDLNDSLFTRGYQIDYYFKAYDFDGYSTTIPADAETGGDIYEFTCLPTLASDILYVDDYGGIGTPDTTVQLYIEQAFHAVLPFDNQPDRYDVNAASSGISNGLGSRAHAAHLAEAYTTIIWDSGDLSEWTICDASSPGDKSQDCEVLSGWIDGSAIPVNLWVMGDNVTSDLTGRGSACSGIFLDLYASVALVEDSYYEMTGGYYYYVLGPDTFLVDIGDAGVLVQGITGTNTETDIFFLDGGIYEPPFVLSANSFDILASAGSGIPLLKYPDFNYTQYYAGVCNSNPNPQSQPIKTVWFGFSFDKIRPSEHVLPEAVASQYKLMGHVLGDYFGITVNSPITGDKTPLLNMSFQNYPNPFNPSTTILFSISERGPVSLRIYNVAGQLIRILVNEIRAPGSYRVSWDGTNNRGSDVASGIYFYRLAAGDFVQTKKMVLLR